MPRASAPRCDNETKIDFIQLDFLDEASWEGLQQFDIIVSNPPYIPMNEKEKLVFVLRFEQELSLKEISDISQIPEGTVKSCLFYLLKKMTHQLKTQQVI